jgi:integrase/recombinase XerD
MRPFRSVLAEKMESYVAYRKHLSYSEKTLRAHLRAFDRYLQNHHATFDELQPAFFLELRSRLTQDPRTVNHILWAVRGFFDYLVRQGFLQDNPLQDIPLLSPTYFVPFVFSPEETEKLLCALCQRIRSIPQYFLKDFAVYLAILLLARCGMRIKEPLHLLRQHFRQDEGTIYIERTKFQKDRLIPLPRAVINEIENYLAARQALIPVDLNPYLLAGVKQNPLNDDLVRRVFHQVVQSIGLSRPKQKIADITFGRPTPHRLRHSFAINTLKRIREQGRSPQHALPILAAYLGHRRYHYTGAYLKVSNAKDVAGLLEFARSQRGAS